MEFIASSEHLCYVRCNFCTTILAVGVPSKRLLDTVTVKCGHCSNLSFITTRPATSHCPPHFPGAPLDVTMNLQPSSSSISSQPSTFLSSSPADSEDSIDRVHHVVKPPEKKHRLPSAYNRFMSGHDSIHSCSWGQLPKLTRPLTQGINAKYQTLMVEVLVCEE